MAKAKQRGNSFSSLADELRERIAKITSPQCVPDPLAVHNKLEVFSSGLYSLDYILEGGWIRGKTHVIEGEAEGGKTTLALLAIASYQRLFPESVHLFINIERHISIAQMQLLGVDINPQRFIIAEPETAEDACACALEAMGYSEKDGEWIRTDRPAVSTIIYDSWGLSPSKKVGLAALARAGSEWLPKVNMCADRTGTTVFIINQIKKKIGAVFGDPRQSTGGDTLKFVLWSKTWVSKVSVIKNEEKLDVAHDIKVEVKRLRSSPIPGNIRLHLNYKKGFDYIQDIMQYCEMRGISLKENENGNVYLLQFVTEDGVGQIRENSRDRFIEALHEHPYGLEILQQKVSEFL